MPKSSTKKNLIKTLQQIAIDDLIFLEISNTDDHELKDKEDEVINDLIFFTTVAEHFRYAVKFVLGSVPKSQHFLINVLPNLDENRFRELVRVSWRNFNVLLNLIKNDAVFNGVRSCRQFPVAMQLMIVLYRLGSCGEGASITKVACLFGISDGGTIQELTARVFKAILNLKSKFLYWPDAIDRRELVAKTMHELPHCIGYVDGTEIKLAEKPFQDPEAYFSRKHIYSLKVQAICDYEKKIRHMVVGYPGSVHDSRIYSNCDLARNTSEYFSENEWLVGDSAYKLTTTVITPYRTNATEGSTQERTNFNSTLSKYRIRIEHAFGMQKERFNSLKELKIELKNDGCIKHACRWILVCSILHNIIIEQKNEEDNFEPANNFGDDDLASDYDIDENTNHNACEVEGTMKRRALLEVIKELNN